MRDGKLSSDAGARPRATREPGRRRAGSARPRVLARRHAALRALHRHRRRHAGRRVRDARTDAPTRDAVTSILHVEQPQPNHNGGQLAFGPDGYLYLGLGDGGGAGDRPGPRAGGNGQSLGTLLGKILRIDPSRRPATRRTRCRADNPFVGHAGAEPEIWAYGLRNPWRFSFDRKTGDLWIGDVGQNEYEEIDRVPATTAATPARATTSAGTGSKATTRTEGKAPDRRRRPVYEIAHDTGACSVTGGYVYRGTKIPGLDGTYFFSDNCDGTIRLLVPDGDGVTRHADAGLEASAVSSFGQANNGTLYVVSLTDGVYRIDAA